MNASLQGETREARLPQGPIRYRDSGAGEPVVFVHGFLVNGLLWRKVVPALERDCRCIVPDWPLGSHPVAMEPGADLSPPGLARLVADFLEALGLERATLVGNDTGGAVCQLVATSHPERVGRLMLTPSDAYDNFPPPMFGYLKWTARVPGAFAALAQSLRLRPLRRLPIAFGRVAKRPLDPDVVEAWVRPVIADRAVRRDTVKVVRGIDTRYTLEAAERLRRFERPALIAWAPEDRLFPLEHGERLAATIPGARLERIEDSYTFVPEDQPARLAELIAELVREPVGSGR